MLADPAQDVLENGLVEVDAAEMFDAFGCAEDTETGVLFLQHTDVEGAAAQVVDGHLRVHRQIGAGGVLDGGRFGLGAGQRRRQVGHRNDLVHQLALVATPVGRMGEHHLVWCRALAFGGGADHERQQPGGQGLG